MVAFSFWGVSVYWYGIFYVIGFLVAYWFLNFVARKKYFSDYSRLQFVLEKKLDDFLLVCVAGVLIGGRLGDVLIYNFAYFLAHPIKIFAVWEGGMSFVGGGIGVVLAVWFFQYWYQFSRDEKWLLYDLMTAIVPFGVLIGRIGNFLNQELYGLTVQQIGLHSERLITFLQTIGVFHIYPQVDSLLRVNTNFLASFFEGFVLLILMQLIFWKKLVYQKINFGVLAACWLFCYSFFRFFLEYLRYDSSLEFFGWFSKSQYFMIFFMIFSVVVVSRRIKKKK
ncbi:MAG TPA: prolipoprotein diacylglyceryl transferase [Candidatus Absconditabacterales bacterium]|nr:prolipoprotein diacylglyceryl transferase [Candidatus Absconditabacterales bacterium]HMT27312.1 prolipoprotein diacylglyceryl transferase [Candidatus Absconditabacterales bacterium]